MAIRLGTRGSDDIGGTDGHDLVIARGGNDVIDAGGGNDLVFGGRGHDTIDGGDGNDLLFGGSGRDTLRGGAGHDLLVGGSGSDRLIYNLGDNVGSQDLYLGGSGCDTLVLELTEAQQSDAALMAEIAAFNTSGSFAFCFETIGLTVTSIENIEIVRIGPSSPSATDDQASTDEDSAVTFDVLANDAGSGALSVQIAPDADFAGTATVNADGSISFDPAGAFDGLLPGQTATVTIPYIVTDEAGETDTANLVVTVTGVNDALEIVGQVQVVSVERSDVDGEVTFTATSQFTVVDPDDGDTIDVEVIDGSFQSVGPNSGGDPGPAPDAQIDISFAVGDDGVVTQTATYGEDANGLYVYDILVTDGGGATDVERKAFLRIYDEFAGTDGADVFDQRDDGGRFGRYDLDDGDDIVFTGDGTNVVEGGAGNDQITGGANGDRLNGDGGDDTIFGEGGRDRLHGGEGDDDLFGGAGSDRIDGGGGDDLIVAGEGNDQLTGGEGADEFVFEADAGATGRNTITDFETGMDTLVIEERADAAAPRTAQGIIDDVEIDGSSFIYTIDENQVVVTDTALSADDIRIETIAPVGPLATMVTLDAGPSGPDGTDPLAVGAFGEVGDAMPSGAFEADFVI